MTGTQALAGAEVADHPFPKPGSGLLLMELGSRLLLMELGSGLLLMEVDA